MRTFFIDLASHAGLLACTEDARVCAATPIDHRISDADLVPLFERLLDEAAWERHSIERIACVSGPGGFTSLRVAAAFTNALAYALDVPVAPIHLSDLRAARTTERDFVWLHSTKKTQLFARGFGALAERYPEPTLVDLPAFASALPQAVSWVGELIAEHEEALKSSLAKHADERDVLVILPAFLAHLSYAKNTLEPWYGRGW